MAHHSSDFPLHPDHDETQKKLVEMFKNRTADSDSAPGDPATLKRRLENLGATGEHPQGKLAPHDEGGLRYAVGVMDGKVVLDFGKSVRSLGMDPDQAEQLAKTLRKKAKRARR